MSLERDRFTERSGTGGAQQDHQIVTSSRVRATFHAKEPVIEMPPIVGAPRRPLGLGSGEFFFRDRGDGKSQLCVEFPSGAIQILATEP